MTIQCLTESLEFLEVGTMLLPENRSIKQVLNLLTVVSDARTVDSRLRHGTAMIVLDVGRFLETCNSHWVITCPGPRHTEIIERLQILGHDCEGLFERQNSLPQCPPFHQGKSEIVQRFEVRWLQFKRAAIRVDGFREPTFLFQRNAEVVV